MSTEARRLRVLAAEDEPMARATLRRLLSAERDVELLGVCADGIDALEQVRATRPDLLLLDVQMPGRTGFEVVEALEPGERPLVIFTTAYDHYAIRAFEVHAVDYLLKPFDDARFASALQRAREQLAHADARAGGDELNQLLRTVREGEPQEVAASEPSPAGKLRIQREGSTTWVAIDAIEWIESADQYVRLHTRDGGDHLMRESMAKLERELDSQTFSRVHRSAIVRLDRVTRLESTGAGGGRLFLEGGQEVPVSRSRMAALRRRLD